MLGQLTRYIFLSLSITLTFTSRAQTVVDSLINRLANADNMSDSVTLLFNIYDCAPYSIQGKTLEDLYDLALHHADQRTLNDVLKRSSDHYKDNDSVLQVLIARAHKLPDGPDKQSTLVYLNVRATHNSARSLSKDEREDMLRKYLAQHTKSQKYDFYERITYLFQLCSYLRLTTDGELLSSYLQELQTLIDSLPENNLALKYLFYSRASSRYLENGMTDEAIAANKALLAIIAELEMLNAKMGRTSRNYDKVAFRCYLNLLLCHDSLTKDEIEEYYNKITPLIDRYPDLLVLSGERKKPTISLLMSKQHYAEAIPLIKSQLTDTTNTPEEQIFLVEALVKATGKAGNRDDLLMALEMSNNLIEKSIEQKASESCKELQVIYEVNDLKRTNDELLLTNQEIEIKRHKDQLVYGIISLIVLVILIVIVVVLYRRSKKLTSELTEANAMITDERDTLERRQNELLAARDKAKMANRIKNDFVNNMAHEIRTPLESIVEYSHLIAECAEIDKAENFDRYADIITLNSDLLLALVNEVLELPSLESTKFGTRIAKTSVQNICEVVIDSVRDYLKPGVDLIFINEGQPDSIILSDPDRLEQVLINLLINAAQNTDRGSITLQYALSSENNKITFTVSDTGTGVSDDEKVTIFSRINKPNSPFKGKNLSLYISRLIVRMLGGSLTLDNDYRSGAKFTFTIPLS